MMKTPSTVASVMVALCSLSDVDERVKDGVAARIRCTCRRKRVRYELFLYTEFSVMQVYFLLAAQVQALQIDQSCNSSVPDFVSKH